MKCLTTNLEVNYPCSALCPVYGDCVTAFQEENKQRVRTRADRIRAMSDMDNQPAAQAPAAQYPFTKREREILQALRHVKSMSLEAVARNLYMSRNTVLYHVDKMKRMTGHDPRTFEGLAACLKMMGEERYGH